MEFHNGSKYQNYKSFSKKLVAKAEELLFEVQLLLVYLPKPSCLVELFPGSLTGDECAVLRIWRPLYTLDSAFYTRLGLMAYRQPSALISEGFQTRHLLAAS